MVFTRHPPTEVGGDPQDARPSVEDDLKVLSGSPHGHLSVVLDEVAVLQCGLRDEALVGASRGHHRVLTPRMGVVDPAVQSARVFFAASRVVQRNCDWFRWGLRLPGVGSIGLNARATAGDLLVNNVGGR